MNKIIELLSIIINGISAPARGLAEVICAWCIEIMKHLSNVTGLSYLELNTYLFVVLGPLISFLLFISTILALRNKRKPAITVCCISVAMAFGIFALCAYGLLTCPVDLWARYIGLPT